ncbi:MAG: hypothetical protein FIA95_17280, partial [Gemmatimonadetes bacterium]|nr:hypothetical protein [Gemmatimonadota bacterium]
MSRLRLDARSYRVGELLRRLWTTVREGGVFFMAGAVAFNLLVAVLPLLLLAVGIAGYVLAAQVGDPVEATVALVVGLMPEGAGG